ncbi:uncharacterized protein [Acropora muricata]|uniref:uncharacterized protein n=1 Tax=Acropora muricata TaxID=159855 RepID=UPI0034E4A06A
MTHGPSKPFSFGIIAENFEVFENDTFDCKVSWVVELSSAVCTGLLKPCMATNVSVCFWRCDVFSVIHMVTYREVSVKKSRSKICGMAKVSKAVWKEFQEVNSFPSYSNSLRWGH